MAAVAGQAVELDEGELDLLVAVVAALLAGVGAEGGADVGDIALEDVEEAAAAGGEEVGDAAFEEVAEVVELVVVAEVGPALVGLAAEIPGVEVAVGRLGAGEVVGDRLDLRLDVGVAAVGEGVGGGLDPLADVGVPEDLDGEVVLVAREAQRRRRVGEGERRRGCRVGASWTCWLGMVRVRTVSSRSRQKSPSMATSTKGTGASLRSFAGLSWSKSRTTRVQGRRQTPLSRGSGDHLEQAVAGLAAEGAEVHVDAGERRAGGERHHLPVVEADDGDVAGDGEAALAEGVGGAAGDLVVAAEEGVGRVAPLSRRRATASRPQASDQGPER